MKTSHRLALAIAALALSVTACGSTGPCQDYADVSQMLHEKLLNCSENISTGVKSVVLPEMVTACEPYAATYCTTTDEAALTGFRTCVENLADCSGSGATFLEAFHTCGDQLKTVSDACNKALSGL